MIDIKDILNEISTNNVCNIINNIGHTDIPKRNRHGYMFRTSLCHAGVNFNLQYFEDSKDFYCFSECRKKHSIFDLVSRNKDCTFIEAIDYVANAISFNAGKYINRKASECWSMLQQFKMNRKLSGLNFNENKVYPEQSLNQFTINPVQLWIDDGINYETQQKFEVGYSVDDERIIVPHRQWDTGNVIGVMGRTTNTNYDKLGIPKWYPLFDFNKNYNLYGFWQNKNAILNTKEVILMESEKSPLKGCSMGINNICATSGKSISPMQMKILIKMGVDVVIGFDKDVDVKKVKAEADKLKHYLKVSIINTDSCEKLDKKDAPIDKGIKLFKELYNNRIQVN